MINPPPETPAVASEIESPKHHRFGPSSLKHREICPGWKNDQTSDKSKANEGTLMHLAFEKRDLSILTAEQKEQVQKCIGYVTRFEKGALEIHKEVRLVVLDGMTFGTADLVIIRTKAGKKHADVIDEKYGRAEIDDPKDNRQGLSYMLATFAAWDVETVTVHFLIPRRDEVLTHTFTRADIPKNSLIIAGIIARAEHWDKTRDESMLVMEETNCTYCGRKAGCPKMWQFGLEHSKRYAPLDVAEETHSSQITDPARMALLYRNTLILEKMVGSVKKHVQEFAREHELPGFSRRERKGSAKITSSTLAWPVLLKIFGITKLEDLHELIACADFSYNDIAKLVAARAPKGKKTEAMGQLWIALQDAECVVENEATSYLQRDKEVPITVGADVIEVETKVISSVVQGAAVA